MKSCPVCQNQFKPASKKHVWCSPRCRLIDGIDIRSEDECWEWRGNRRPDGYGVISLGRGAMARAHRFAYQVFAGPVPADMDVCHKCDNRACANPRHLFLGSHAENMADMAVKGRAGPKEPARGQCHWNARITPGQVKAIRMMAGPSRGVARQFGVSSSLVRKIKSGRVWKHI
jgi:hypothetical protein